jgi:hypothetical protein
MERVAATIVAALAWTACSMAGPGQPLPIEPGQDFSLRAGESAQARDTGLRVGFKGVTADSRCPKGERCVWAGDAIARVWLQLGSSPRETRELHTAAGAAQAAYALDHELRLLRLEPYPVTGKAIAKGDYVATLRLARGSGSEPER